MMDDLRSFTNACLPTGAPFIVGGGLVRDALLGGRPSDIDIWMPGNITWANSRDFMTRLGQQYPGADIQLIFSLPERNNNMFTGEPMATAEGDTYGDLNNHWVIEMQIEGWPRVNFMRTLHPWTTPQPFFNALMRNFDIDACMFFVGWMPGQRECNTVIMPRHMTQGNNRQYNLNEIYWNQHRMNVTSAARIEARLVKMCTKYCYRNMTMGAIERDGRILQTDRIIATPVAFRDALSYTRGMPDPTILNRRENIGDEWERHVLNYTNIQASRKAMEVANAERRANIAAGWR